MYTIFKNSAPLGYTDSPVFIRLQSNGCYGLCDVKEAQGVVFNGTPYHLLGKPDIPGLETVMVVETDGGPLVETLQAKTTAMTTTNQMLEDCIVEMAGVVYA